MGLVSAAQKFSFRVNVWYSEHKSEVIIGVTLAVVCAIAFGYPIAALIAPPTPAPFKIYVVAEADNQTVKQFEASKAAKSLSIGSVPVQLQVEVITQEQDNADSAKEKARELLSRGDTLMVVGHYASQATEAALPVYFGARPQVPFIATVQTDDDLTKKCHAKADDTLQEQPPACSDGTHPLPLLQLSPTNTQQAKWAIQFATSKGKRRFLIVPDSDPRNHAYVESLANAYRDELNRYTLLHPDHHATVVNGLIADFSPSGIRDQNPDCVLYAGGIDGAGALLKKLKESELPVMVLLSDSSVRPSGDISDDDLSGFSPVNFTNQIDAGDYNSRTSVFGLDGIAIAARLVTDLKIRGLDRRFRFKSLFGLETAADARRNLLRVMRENAMYHSFYVGASETASAVGPTVYAFAGYQRLGGIFHVWERSKPNQQAASEISDVDGWHPPRESSPNPGQGITAIAKR